MWVFLILAYDFWVLVGLGDSAEEEFVYTWASNIAMAARERTILMEERPAGTIKSVPIVVVLVLWSRQW